MFETEVKKIEEQVEKVISATPVSKAQEIMKSRSGLWLIVIISFIESSLPLPILTDPFMVAAIILDRAKTVKIVLATIISSVFGGVVAYFSALFFFEKIMLWLTPNLVEQFNVLVSVNDGANVFVLTIIGAVTPVPYTLVAWAVAVLQGSLLVFVLASTIGRTIRYAIVGFCVYYFGPMAIKYAKKYLALTSVVIFILAAIYVWIKL